MIQSSGFFGTPRPLPDLDNGGLELLHAPEDGYCCLYKGHRNDRVVVYKVLRAGFRDDPVHQRMLRREYEIGVSLKHPGICEVLAWTRIPGYGDGIEMEWVDGVTLRSYLEAGPHPDRDLRKILAGLCDALSYLHRKQVVHKDLKPENILITHQGQYPKLIDFGLSDSDSILTGKDPGGTLQYAAPEVLEGRAADARSDIYSLGRIMQEMGPEFSRIARKCTESDPSKRYGDAEEIRRDLMETPKRHRRLLGLIPIILFLAVAITGLWLSLHHPDPVEQLFHDAFEQVRNAATPS